MHALYAYAMHAYVDVGMQVRIFVYMNAYACICCMACIFHSHGEPILGTQPMWGGGGTVKPGTQDIYIYIYIYIHIYIHI